MFGFLAQLLAWCFDLVPNYAVAILLFTVIVMAAVTPFTIKGMRSAAEMSRLQPEMKKLQDQYKNDKVKQNEEMQALFKEHGVNPLGGCLPMLLPLPIFFIIFRLLRGLNGRHNGVFAPLVRVLRHQVGGPNGFVAPHYLSYKAQMTQKLIASNGVMKSFGMDLSATARQHHPSVAAAIPFYALIVIMTAAQYWQQRQISQRTPPSAQTQQTKLMMQLFPAFYALISLSIPASVVFYLFASSLFRMIQTSLSYRFDPIMARAAVLPASAAPSLKAGASSKGGGGGPDRNGGPGRNGAATRGGSQRPVRGGRTTSPDAPKDAPPPKRGFLASLREAADQAKATSSGSSGPGSGSSGSGSSGSGSSGSGSSGSGSSGSGSGSRSPDRPSRPERPQRPQRGGGAASRREAATDSTSTDTEPDDARPSAPPVSPSDLRSPSDARPDSSRSPLSVRPSGRVTPPGGGGKRSKKRG